MNTWLHSIAQKESGPVTTDINEAVKVEPEREFNSEPDIQKDEQGIDQRKSARTWFFD